MHQSHALNQITIVAVTTLRTRRNAKLQNIKINDKVFSDGFLKP